MITTNEEIGHRLIEMCEECKHSKRDIESLCKETINLSNRLDLDLGHELRQSVLQAYGTYRLYKRAIYPIVATIARAGFMLTQDFGEYGEGQ